MTILAQTSDLLANPNILQGIGLGGVAWVIKKLRRLEKRVDLTHQENMHARRVIADKLGIPPEALKIPVDETI